MVYETYTGQIICYELLASPFNGLMGFIDFFYDVAFNFTTLRLCLVF